MQKIFCFALLVLNKCLVKKFYIEGAQSIQLLTVFLAALSSSRSVVVNPSVGPLVGPSVRLPLWKRDLKSIKR